MPLSKPCILYIGTLTRKGYGALPSARHGTRKAHRVAYIETYGAIPTGLHILHHCDIRNCIEPTHLYAGTNLDNIKDRVARGRSYIQQGESGANHKLTEIEALEILASNESQRSLARRYRVTQGCISKLKLRKTWQHLK